MVNLSLVFSIAGMALSLYALHVEHESSQDSSFRSLCDFSPEVSCSKVFQSEYGKIWSKLGLIPKDSVLDQPNALYGFVFYCIIATTTFFKKNAIASHVALFFGAASVLLSAYLGYILAFVMKHFCALCVSTYVCNGGIFIDSYIKLKARREEIKAEKAKKKT
jgi:vitamin-K-epoxide reductase (warfarin-sensitive)